VKPKSVLRLFLLIVLWPFAAWAQSPNPAASGVTTQEVTYGGYLVHQSVEAGYRFSDLTGSEAMFNTMVNLHEGPRILEQSLSMQSENHQGMLFDDLFVNSAGWGGEPNNYLRMRVGKNQWYDFRASFRRDQDFFDFNLLANPLNPTTSVPNVPLDSSAHGFQTRRRMSDFDLTLLPRQKVSFRLGFSHNNMTGPS